MGLSRTDWSNIDRRINEIVRLSTAPVFTQGTVIKADPDRNLIWLRELGDQPVPLFTFDYKVTYYDTQALGLIRRDAIVKPKCPQVGDVVLVAKQYGSRSLPKCLGVLRSRGFEAITE